MKSFLSLILIMLLAASCSFIDEPDRACPAEGEEKNLYLSFQMLLEGVDTGSRADSQGHDEVDSEYKAFEDGIDLQDIGLLIFAKMHGSDNPEQRVATLINVSNATDQNIEVIGAPGAYTVNVMFVKSALDDILGTELSPNGATPVDFRILMLTSSSTGGTSPKPSTKWWESIDGATYGEVIADLNEKTYTSGYVCNFNNAYAEDAKIEDKTVEELYPNRGYFGRSNMPMFGTSVYTITQSELYESRPENRVYLGTINLLRSMAKVRVVDNIQNKHGDYPRVAGAILIGSQNYICPVPAGALTYENGNQVHTPHLPSTANDGQFMFLLGRTTNNTPAVPHTGDIRVGYVPEMMIDNINNDVAQGMPYFRIKVELGLDTDNKIIEKTYDVPMTGYKNQSFNFGKAVLRNHIYTLSVDEAGTHVDVKITPSVEEWKKGEPLNLDFTQTVYVAPEGKLDWTLGTYDKMSPTGDGSVTIVMKEWALSGKTSKCVPLEGKFLIQTPVGATWTASLINKSGDFGDAFSIERVVDGETGPAVVSNSISGKVEGKSESGSDPAPVRFRIRTLNEKPQGSQPNVAELQIVVAIDNGGVMSVIDAPVYPENVTRYVIVQNP